MIYWFNFSVHLTTAYTESDINLYYARLSVILTELTIQPSGIPPLTSAVPTLASFCKLISSDEIYRQVDLYVVRLGFVH